MQLGEFFIKHRVNKHDFMLWMIIHVAFLIPCRIKGRFRRELLNLYFLQDSIKSFYGLKGKVLFFFFFNFKIFIYLFILQGILCYWTARVKPSRFLLDVKIQTQELELKNKQLIKIPFTCAQKYLFKQLKYLRWYGN